MPMILTDGCRIRFEPPEGCEWQSFTGVLSVAPPKRPLNVGNAAAILADDLRALADRLPGMQYIAGEYSIPGTITTAEIRVEESSLCARTRINGAPVANTDTRGTYKIDLNPALRPGAPPQPDSQTSRSGRWRVESQTITLAFSE